MRVALAHAFSWPEVRRGGERLVAEMAKSLAGLGHDVTVFSSAFEHWRARTGSVREVRFRRWRRETFAAETDFGLRLLPALVAGRFDVVHTHGRRDALASLRAARVHPRRATVHTDIGIPSRSWWRTMGKEGDYAERVIHGVDTYACMSEHALGVLLSDYGRHGVLLPGGVDLSRFRPAEARTTHPTILYSGSLDEPRKGVASLLEALPLIAKEEPHVRLWLSGPGDASTLVAAAPAAARDRTDVLGQGDLAEQPDRYGRAWTCALPSLNDTFGLVLIEALACGTPVVASNNAALPELVRPGVTGTLCEHGEPASIAAACVQSIALARQSGTAEACRDFARPYDWATGIGPRCVTVYEEALATR